VEKGKEKKAVGKYRLIFRLDLCVVLLCLGVELFPGKLLRPDNYISCNLYG